RPYRKPELRRSPMSMLMSKTKTTTALLSLFLGAAPAVAKAQGPAVYPPPPPPEIYQPVTPQLSGWDIAPTTALTSFKGLSAGEVGIRGALLLNRRLGVGLAANVFGNHDTDLGENRVRAVGAYGGFYAQYVFHSNEVIHMYLDGTVGSGVWCEEATTD